MRFFVDPGSGAVHDGDMENAATTATPATLTATDRMTLGKRSYSVEVVHTDADQGLPIYTLTGKRGACYVTMRNVHDPHMMVVYNSRNIHGTCGALEGVWLTDRNGHLEIAS